MTEGIKHDTGKPPMSLLPFAALTEVAKVLDFGAKKYSKHNWRDGFEWTRLSDAALRHLGAFLEGKNNDDETGLPELAHATCCLLFLLEHQLKGYGTDDRYNPEPKVKREKTQAEKNVDEMFREIDKLREQSFPSYLKPYPVTYFTDTAVIGSGVKENE